ncbi:hypothetical protein [Actinopolyspora xinjiangensis]|uniref:hypothetical protein n=1 Tax=Actinopolyspora xinjiangensis TaxID=405564 RepID=UPI001FCD301E|nr:hypothetical protein [Actinopolyspora xinjiangensis]
MTGESSGDTRPSIRERVSEVQKTIDGLLEGSDKGFKEAVGSGLKAALNTLLGNYGVRVFDQIENSVTVIDEVIVRVDTYLWKYNFEKTALTQKCENAMCYCVVLSYVLPEEVPLPLCYLMVGKMVERRKDLSEQQKKNLKEELNKKVEEAHKKGGETRNRMVDIADLNKKIAYPEALAVGSTGNLFVIDSGKDAAVWKKTPSAQLTKVTGGGTSDEDDIPATQARLYYPFDVSVDGTGVVTVVDSNAQADGGRFRPGAVSGAVAGEERRGCWWRSVLSCGECGSNADKRVHMFPRDGRVPSCRGGTALAHRRYDHLWHRLGRYLPWVAT